MAEVTEGMHYASGGPGRDPVYPNLHTALLETVARRGEEPAIRSEHGGRAHAFELVLFVPNDRPGPATTFLLMNNRGPGNTDPSRAEPALVRTQSPEQFWIVQNPGSLIVSWRTLAGLYIPGDRLKVDPGA